MFPEELWQTMGTLRSKNIISVLNELMDQGEEDREEQTRVFSRADRSSDKVCTRCQGSGEKWLTDQRGRSGGKGGGGEAQVRLFLNFFPITVDIQYCITFRYTHSD